MKKPIDFETIKQLKKQVKSVISESSKIFLENFENSC